jgi:shikimate kinase
MKNIYLVGFMGTGKTVVGKILAKRLNKEFIEMDEVIQQREGKEIVDIFSQKGEDYFRKLEKNLLTELSKREDLVISCGGGLVCHEENLNVLKETGVVFSLMASASVIYERTKKYIHRPLLNVDNPLKEIEELLVKRARCYNQAHYTIKSEEQTPEEVANAIINLIEAEFPGTKRG